MNNRWIGLLFILLTILLAACGPEGITPETSTGVGVEDPSMGAELGAESVTVPPAAEEAVDAAIAYVVEQAGVSEEEISVISIEPVDWRDTSLGCPEPGTGYAQVITPGYRIRIEAGGQEFEVHTDETGQNIASCANPWADAERAAVEYVASELEVSTGEVEVLSVESVEWPDASLGCPKEGEMYADVVTPGYLFVLEAQGRRIEIHTDEKGETVVFCTPTMDQPLAAAIALVAEEKGISEEEIVLLSAEPVDWPDSSLGCPQPETAYLQVITPGYKIVVLAGEEEVEVHTDMTGQNVVICSPSQD